MNQEYIEYVKDDAGNWQGVYNVPTPEPIDINL
jgi:hypothetical protein